MNAGARMRAAFAAAGYNPLTVDDAGYGGQQIVAPQLRLPGHKIPPGRLPPAGKVITAARAAAPTVYAKRTAPGDRWNAAQLVRRAVAILRARARRIFKMQDRPCTDAEHAMFAAADAAARNLDTCRAAAANTPTMRAELKAIIDRALTVIDRLEQYRGR